MAWCWYVLYNNERKFSSSRDFLSSLSNARLTFGPSIPMFHVCWVQVVCGLFIVIEEVVCSTVAYEQGCEIRGLHSAIFTWPHPAACSVPPQLVTHQITVHGLVIAPCRIIVSWWNMGQVQMLWHIWILTRSLNNLLQFHYHWTFSWMSHLRQHLNFQRSGSKHISKPIKSLHQRLFWTTPPKFSSERWA